MQEYTFNPKGLASPGLDQHKVNTIAHCGDGWTAYGQNGNAVRYFLKVQCQELIFFREVFIQNQGTIEGE